MVQGVGLHLWVFNMLEGLLFRVTSGIDGLLSFCGWELIMDPSVHSQ